MTSRTPTATKESETVGNASAQDRVHGNPLTANDKAATYLDWQPFICAGNPPEWADQYGNRAPDLSDPRNYMKALENCDIWEKCQECFEGTERQWNVQRGPSRIVNGIQTRNHGTGATPIEALAALYDAEHPTESR